MIDDLHPCPGCVRHVRRRESSCPFCATPLSLADAPYRPAPVGRITRSATLAFATLVGAQSAGCTTPSVPPDTGANIPIYGLPDAPSGHDAGTDGGD